jgi:hypothetical protein
VDTLLNATQPTQVELLCMTDTGPIMFEGRARYGTEEEEIEIDLSSPVQDGLSGSQAIITFLTKNSPRVTAKIIRAEGNRLSLTKPRIRPRDKRLYPRLFGNIPLRYRAHVAEDGELAIHRWLAGSSHEGPTRSLRTPEPFMNFSVSGLCFEDTVLYNRGDLLFVEFGVGEGESRWHATGRIVRVDQISEAPDSLYQIAINFETLPDAAMEALSDFTLAIQEALL